MSDRSKETLRLRTYSSNNQHPPVLVIVGATGSGKTGLGIAAAKPLNGEVISADSRAIYREMDIGTAKPSMKEREGVMHHGFDLLWPGERFSAYDFTEYARVKIAEIRARGKLPIVVGGTGLYVDALVYGYQFDSVVKKTCSDREAISGDFVLVGIEWGRMELRERLRARANKLFKHGVLEETAYLVEKYGWDKQIMQSNIYPIAWNLMRGEIDFDEAVRRNEIADWHLAKRQLTWLKRNKNINWMKLEECLPWIRKFYSV